MSGAAIIEAGFATPVFDAQRDFRAVMNALANPGTVHDLTLPRGPAPLPAELAAVALTLCDHDTPIWLSPDLATLQTVRDWVAFHLAALITDDTAKAQFAFVSSAAALPPLVSFALGTDEYPDRSTTIVLALPALSGGPALTLRGPGIDGERAFAPQGLPPDFPAQWNDNRALYPRGIDLLLVAGGQVAGMPRTTRSGG